MYSSSNSSSFVPEGGAELPERKELLETSSDCEESARRPVGCWADRGVNEIPKNCPELVRQELAGLTGLQTSVIELLYSRFRLLARDGFMTYRCFKRSLGMMALLDETFLPERLFRAFDIRDDGVLDFMEWCASLGIMMKGSEEERLEFSFRILRTPGKGVLRRGNSLRGPLWRGVQQNEMMYRQATWKVIYGKRNLSAAAAAAAGEDESGGRLTPPHKGSRSWVTYMLATDPTDPSNVITMEEFVYIVRALEATRNQLTADLTTEKMPETVIRDVFTRACGTPHGKPLLTLDSYKTAVTSMPEFLEVLGIPALTQFGGSDDVYKTPKSSRRLLSDPGRDATESGQSVEVLTSVRTELINLVRLINRESNESLPSLLLSRRKRERTHSLSLSRSAHLRLTDCLVLEHDEDDDNTNDALADELTTPQDTPVPVIQHQLSHGLAFPNNCDSASNMCRSSDGREIPVRYLSPADALPTGQRVRRIGQAVGRGNTATTHVLGHEHSSKHYTPEQTKIVVNTKSILSSLGGAKHEEPPNRSSCPFTAHTLQDILDESTPLSSNTPDDVGSVTSDSSYYFTATYHDRHEKPPDVASSEPQSNRAIVVDEQQPSSDEEIRQMAYRIIEWIDHVVHSSNLDEGGCRGNGRRSEKMFVNATNFSVLKSYRMESSEGLKRNSKIPVRVRRGPLARNRAERKILDVGGGRKGMVVHFGHRSWNLVLNMMLGIRMAAYRCLTERNHEIDSYDFLVKETFCVLPRVSNIIEKVRKHSYEIIRFIDYAPMVFRQIREIDNLNGPDYLDSVGPEKLINNIILGNLSSLSELYTEGKSGSIFYYTNDGRFIVKTIDSKSAKLLRGHILKSYYEHLNAHRNSFIIRIYGFHALKIQLGDHIIGAKSRTARRVKKLYFIVMKNIFHTNCIIHRRYDLKGSWIGRTTLGPDGTVPRIVQTPANSLVPTEAIIIGQQETHAAAGGFWDPTISLKDIDMMKLQDFIKVNERDQILRILECDSKFLSQLHLIDYSLLIGIHVNGLDEKTIIPPTTPIKEAREFANNTDIVPAANAYMSEDKSCQYFLGIVDILTLYTNTKRFEHFCKSITKDHEGISCVKPTKYQDRFQRFMDRVFVKPD